MGTPPVPNLYAGLAGIKLVLDANPEKIWDHVSGLGSRIFDIADELGIPVRTPRAREERGTMVALEALEVVMAVNALGADNVIVSARDSHVRVSPHLYNNFDDLDRLAASIEANRSLFA